MFFSSFLRKVLKVVQAQIYFSRLFDFWFLFKLTSFHLLKEGQTQLLNSKKVKARKNVIDF